MVGHKMQNCDASHLRKLRKPLIEKKRRERINNSIDSLKKILTESRQGVEHDTKMDKAEILELTVNHLTKDQRKPTMNHSYSQGYSDCSRETIQFLSATGVLDPESLLRLQSHLQQVQATQQLTVPVAITSRQQDRPRLCSTPESYSFNLSFSGNATMATSPMFSPNSVDSFISTSSSDQSTNGTSGSDYSLLGNILSDEKPWRPW